MGLHGIEWVESNKGAIKRALQLQGLPHTHHAGEDAAELAAIFEAILQSRQTVGRV
jgi:hypothetical protein